MIDVQIENKKLHKFRSRIRVLSIIEVFIALLMLLTAAFIDDGLVSMTMIVCAAILMVLCGAGTAESWVDNGNNN